MSTESGGSARAGPPLRMIVAVAVAGAGIALGGWSIWRHAGGASREFKAPTPQPRPGVVAAHRAAPPSDEPARPMRNLTFPSVASESDFSALVAEAPGAVGARLVQHPDLGSTTESTRRQIAEHVGGALAAALSGSTERLGWLITGGSPPPESESASRSLDPIAELLRNASFDAASAEVSYSPDGTPIMPRREAGGGGFMGVMRFGARGEALPGAPTAEVRVPVRLAGSSSGEGDLDLGVSMRWNSEAGAWKPDGFSLYVRDRDVMNRLAQLRRNPR